MDPTGAFNSRSLETGSNFVTYHFEKVLEVVFDIENQKKLSTACE